MIEAKREREQVTISKRDLASFRTVKEKLEQRLGVSLTTPDVIRHCIAAQMKQLEAPTDGR